MMAGFRLTRLAQHDIDRITSYSLHTWGLSQSEAYLVQLDACFRALVEGDAQERDRSNLLPGVRTALCGQHIVAFTRSRIRQIVILRVLPQSMEFWRPF
jgi:plasmid stabilization system protein ParE